MFEAVGADALQVACTAHPSPRSNTMASSIGNFSLSKAGLAAFLLFSAALLGGCGSVGGIQALDTPSYAGTAIRGAAHGGQQAITGATVQMWSVGSTGYGSAATPLISSKVTTSDGTGVTITAWSLDVTGAVATFTAGNSYTTGSTVSLAGFTASGSTFLNGQTVAVLTSSGAQFTGVVTGGTSNASASATGYANLSSDTNGNAGNTYNTLSAGYFNITGDYTCGGTDVYVTATGGNPGTSSNNAAIVLGAPLGTCTQLASDAFLSINEVTTVGLASALGPFFTSTFGSASTDSFGAPNTTQAQIGISNAFQTALVLVNPAMGTANTSLTGSPSTVTVTPNSAKLLTVANILASCVNSDGQSDSTCPTLFSNVVTSTGTAPTDTLQAAVYMTSLNPTSNNAASGTASNSLTNMTTLYGLSSPMPPFVVVGSSPFIGTIGTQPTDWAISIVYTDSAGTLFPAPKYVAIDSKGNPWILNTGLLTEFSGSAPGTIPFTGSTFSSSNVVLGTAVIRGFAIDTNNNVWMSAGSTSNSYALDYNPGAAASAAGAYKLPSTSGPVAINGNNDVFVAQSVAAAKFGLFEFPGGNIAAPVEYPLVGNIAPYNTGATTGSGNNTYLNATFMNFDTNGNLWMSNGGAGQTYSSDLVELTGVPTDSSIATICGSTVPCALTSTNFTTSSGYLLNTGYTTPWTVFPTIGGSMFVADDVNTTGGVYETSTGTSPVLQGTYGGASRLSVDGLGQIWLTNNGSRINVFNNGVFNGLTPLSTAGNYEQNACDPSGNVWVLSSGASVVYEEVGVAGPATTPIALDVKNGAGRP
jgi:hypothetical protein